MAGTDRHEDRRFGDIWVAGEFDDDGELEISGTGWLGLGEVRQLHEHLGALIHRERVRRGECVCIGFSHQSGCPEWVLPL